MAGAMKPRTCARFLLPACILGALAGCAASQTRWVDQSNAEMKKLDALKQELEIKGAKEHARRQYESFLRECEKAKASHDKGEFKEAVKNAAGAEKKKKRIVKTLNKKGSTVIEVKLRDGPQELKCTYFVTHYEFSNTMFFLFNRDFEVKEREVRGAVKDVYSTDFVLRVGLKPGMAIRGIEASESGVLIRTARPGWITVSVVSLLFDPDLAFRLNRGDKFRWYDWTRAIPYLKWPARIKEAIDASRGSVGADITLKNERQKINTLKGVRNDFKIELVVG